MSFTTSPIGRPCPDRSRACSLLVMPAWSCSPPLSEAGSFASGTSSPPELASQRSRPRRVACEARRGRASCSRETARSQGTAPKRNGIYAAWSARRGRVLAEVVPRGPRSHRFWLNLPAGGGFSPGGIQSSLPTLHPMLPHAGPCRKHFPPAPVPASARRFCLSTAAHGAPPPPGQPQPARAPRMPTGRHAALRLPRRRHHAPLTNCPLPRWPRRAPPPRAPLRRPGPAAPPRNAGTTPPRPPMPRTQDHVRQRPQQPTAQRQLLLTPPVGQQAVVPRRHESPRQHVPRPAPQELHHPPRQLLGAAPCSCYPGA